MQLYTTYKAAERGTLTREALIQSCKEQKDIVADRQTDSDMHKVLLPHAQQADKLTHTDRCPQTCRLQLVLVLLLLRLQAPLPNFCLMSFAFLPQGLAAGKEV